MPTYNVTFPLRFVNREHGTKTQVVSVNAHNKKAAITFATRDFKRLWNLAPSVSVMHSAIEEVPEAEVKPRPPAKVGESYEDYLRRVNA
jgi:hypothetical protein